MSRRRNRVELLELAVGRPGLSSSPEALIRQRFGRIGSSRPRWTRSVAATVRAMLGRASGHRHVTVYGRAKPHATDADYAESWTRRPAVPRGPPGRGRGLARGARTRPMAAWAAPSANRSRNARRDRPVRLPSRVRRPRPCRHDHRGRSRRSRVLDAPGASGAGPLHPSHDRGPACPQPLARRLPTGLGRRLRPHRRQDDAASRRLEDQQSPPPVLPAPRLPPRPNDRPTPPRFRCSLRAPAVLNPRRSAAPSRSDSWASPSSVSATAPASACSSEPPGPGLRRVRRSRGVGLRGWGWRGSRPGGRGNGTRRGRAGRRSR